MDQIPTIPVAAMVQFSVYRDGGLHSFQWIGRICVYHKPGETPLYLGEMTLQKDWGDENGYRGKVFAVRGPDVHSIVDVLLRMLKHTDAPYHAVQGTK